jgi:hypothetical protein
MLCADADWANVGQILAECLQTQGVDAEMFVQYHVGKKANNTQGTVKPLEEMLEIMSEYDVVQFMHSGRRILVPYRGDDSGPNRLQKEPYLDMRVAEKIDQIRAAGVKTTVFHGGTFYRVFHEKIHALDINQFFDATIIQTGDLFDLGGHNEKWLLPAVNTTKIRPRYKSSGSVLSFAHYPSKAAHKNTKVIRTVLKRMLRRKGGFEFKCNPTNVSHVENLKRMRAADVYIEHQMFELMGKKYGEFGITALEAAAVGDIVITCTNFKDRYEQEYGKFVPYVSNSKEEMKVYIKQLLSLSDEEIVEKQKETRQWVVDNHSYKVIGSRLLNLYHDLT